MRPEHKNVPALPPSPHAEDSCRAVASVLARVGDKWSVFVIMMLIDGPHALQRAQAQDRRHLAADADA